MVTKRVKKAKPAVVEPLYLVKPVGMVYRSVDGLYRFTNDADVESPGYLSRFRALLMLRRDKEGA